MPRRITGRCRRRDDNNTISITVETDLTLGHGFGIPGWEMRAVREIGDAWRRWGDEITRRWIEGCPGSRPMACYILGRIPPCRWRHELPALRHPLRPIEGATVGIADCGWHRGPQELEHLLALGLVDAQERRDARDRLAGRRGPAGGRYRPIAEDGEAASPAA